MTAVWSLQEWSFRTPFFLGDRLLEYRQHTFPVTLERATEVARGLLCHSVVAPALRNDRPSFRGVEVASSGPLGAIATLAWAALLLVGSWRTLQSARRGERRELALTAAGSLALMFAMHLTLGRELFLYALSVLPLLLVLAAGSALPERGRTLVRATACVLLVAGAAQQRPPAPASGRGRPGPRGAARPGGRGRQRGAVSATGPARDPHPHLGQVPGDVVRDEPQLRHAAGPQPDDEAGGPVRQQLVRGRARGGDRRWAPA